MPNRTRKMPVKATGQKIRSTKGKPAAPTSSVEACQLPRNVISLTSYCRARSAPIEIATGDGQERNNRQRGIAPLPKGHSAQIILYNGVQIVREDHSEDHREDHREDHSDDSLDASNG